ncbi:MAG TPA: hydroxymethylbilane synthase [Rhizomicrobium sp.]|nr:hydroxymethylbilane synthase [Rhizomicrobium sp.]
MPQPLRLGTRGSRLALVQAEMVRALLARAGADCVLVPVKTSGDRIQDRSLADAGGKGLFTKELEEALLRGEIDLAVHSMKDVPTALPPGLVIAALLPREDPRDAFVSLTAKTLAQLPKGARVGTSSVRRAAQVLRARPDLQTALLRGNVDTRLAKLDAGEFDAMLLALAGLKRLGMAARATTLLDADDWLPALAQGAIGIEVRDGDASTSSIVAALNDPRTEIELACERAFQAALDGTCRTPIGGLARFVDGTLFFRGEVLAPDGSEFADTQFEIALRTAPVREAEDAGRMAGFELKPRVQAWLAA